LTLDDFNFSEISLKRCVDTSPRISPPVNINIDVIIDIKLAIPPGFEPRTKRFRVSCSTRLSYGMFVQI